MISKEILKKVRRIEIFTKNLVNSVFSGEYHSVFKGRGIEFSEVREYIPGDDVRTIDWNVTARAGQPYVKLFHEERELTILLLVDASSSGRFGTIRQLKQEVAAEIGALLAFSAIKNNDRVGLVLFTDSVEKYIPPKKGSKHVLRVIREMLSFEPENRGTDLNCGIEFIGRVIKRKCVIFLISDFLSAGYDKSLKVVNKKHDVIAVSLTDPREVTMPDVGIINLEDAETGEQILVDTSDARVRRAFEENAAGRLKQRDTLFRSIDMDTIPVTTGASYVDPLVRFFRKRANKF
jgi:uncharacterized protein (DUF58 family)